MELRQLEEQRPEHTEYLSKNRPLAGGRSFFSSKACRNAVFIVFLSVLLFALFVASVVPSVTRGRGGGTVASHEPNLPSANDVKFIFVGFRHGNRNPEKFLKNDTTHNEWAWEGPMQLTSIGKRQASSLGQFLRRRYGNLVPAEFFPSQVKAYSSSADRCQQTLQTVMSGFFPPRGRSIWSQSVPWQPVPYEINDPLLRMYNVHCPHYKTSYQAIGDDTAAAGLNWLNRDRELVQYIAQNSGFNASLSDLGDVADNVMNMKMSNIPLPRWITNPTLPGYPPKDMYAAIVSYAEAHQILCANDSECARIMAGHWLDHIIQTMQQLRGGQMRNRYAHFYAAHTETVLSLIRLMKTEGIGETPTSSGLILEYTDVPVPSVRFIFHEPDHNNPDVRLAEVKQFSFCPDQQWCNLDHFVQNVRTAAFSDWKEACKLPKCPV